MIRRPNTRHVLMKNVQLFPTKDVASLSASNVGGLCLPLQETEPHPILMRKIGSGGMIKLMHPESGQQILVPVQPYLTNDDECVPTNDLSGEDLNGLQNILTQHGKSEEISKTKKDAVSQQRDVLMYYRLKKRARRQESPSDAASFVLLPAAHLQKFPNLNLTSVGTVMTGVNKHQLEIARKNSVLRLSHLPDSRPSVAPFVTSSSPSDANSSGAEPEDALDTLTEFVEMFRRRRVELGFTQGDVSAALQTMYGAVWSQTTLSRFEALCLSYRNTSAMMHVLRRWLDDVSRAVDAPSTQATKRKADPKREVVESRQQEGEEEEEVAETSLRTVTLKATGRDAPVVVRYRAKSADLIHRKRRRRTMLSEDALSTLQSVYDNTKMPSSEKINKLAECLSIHIDVVRAWFYNRRAKERREKDFSEIRARGADILNINGDELAIVPERAERRV